MTEEPLFTQDIKSSTSDKTHKVQLFDTFEHCPCKGFEHRGTCKHVKEAKTNFQKSINNT